MDDNKEAIIYSSRDYNKFKIYDWNRQINKGILKRIHKSVTKCGWRQEPIIVDSNYGIIDGQHRYTYAKQHNLPIYYFIADGATREDCQRMNSVRLAWKPQDYIRYYALLGNVDYQRLQALLETYDDFNLGIITYAISDSTTGGHLSQRIVDGTFTCSEADFLKASEMLSYLFALDFYIKRIRGRRTQLYQAIMFCCSLKGFDKERLARRIRETWSTITPPADMESALEILESIYNYRINKENRIYIVTEWKKER